MTPLPTIQVGSVFYIHIEATFIPHFYIVVNVEPLMLLMVTKNIDRVRNLRQGKCSYKTMVVVTPAQYDGFRQDSIVDCNNLDDSRNVEDLERLLGEGKLESRQPLSDGIVKRLIVGILESPLVSEANKNVIKANISK